jgi:signal peptidase II
MYYWLVLALVLVLDQGSKWWISSTFAPGESQALIDGMLWLTYVHNQGAAFSIMQGKLLFFILASALVVAGISIWAAIYRPGPWLALITGLLAGGAAGNLLDRIRLSYVIDFLDLHWWPIFNVADMAIVCGGFLLAWHVYRMERSDING